MGQIIMSLDRQKINVTEDGEKTDTTAAPAAPAEQPGTVEQQLAAAGPDASENQTAAPAVTSTQPGASDTTKEVDIDGYKLKINYDLVDDVENLELINKIENKGYLYGIIEFLQLIAGKDEYEKLKAYFVEKYGKLSLTRLGDIYQKIFEQFDPKD